MPPRPAARPPPPGPRPLLPDWAWPVLLVATVGLLYANTLTAPFVFDDLPAIVENPSIRQLWPLGPVLSPPAAGGFGVAGRPIVNLSLAINHAISGLAPWSYHLANTLIHTLATLMLFGLIRRTLTGPVLGATWSRRALPVAFGGALLWAVHPLQTESVTCVIQRTESLVGLWYLLTLYAFARATTAGSPRTRPGWSLACVAACTLGMATKEVMVTAPVLLLLYDRTFLSGSFRATLKHGGLHAACLATWALLLFLVLGNPLRGGTAGFATVSPWESLLTQSQAIALYLRLTVWPHPLVLDYGAPVVRDLAAVWPQATGLVALLAATGWALARRPVLGFLGAWFFVILSPSSSFIPLLTQTIAEHRMYLPLLAPVLLAIGALAQRTPRLVLPVAAGLALVLGMTTLARNRLYRDPVALWTDNLAHRPEAPRAHVALAGLADQAGDFATAVTHYEAYLQARPEDQDIRFNLARDLVKLGRLPEAAAVFEQILTARPEDTVVRTNYATCLLSARRHPEALREFERIVRSEPQVGQHHFNLAEAYRAASQPDAALTSYAQAAALDPTNGFLFYRYGDALLNARRLTDAVAAYRTAVARQPDLFAAWTNLGGALLMLERPTEAVPAFEAAARLKPDDPQSRQNLAYARSLVR